MNDPIVYVSGRAILNDPPGSKARHRIDRSKSIFPRYLPDPENPGFARRDGIEEHRTFCGRLIYRHGDKLERGLVAFREDVADRFTRECWICYPEVKARYLKA